MLGKHQHDDPIEIATTIEDEMKFNVFFRLQNHEIIDRLRVSFPDLDPNPSPETVFLKLRELRNDW